MTYLPGMLKIYILQYGFGTPAPIPALADVFDPTLALIWADGTNASSDTHPSAADVMSLVVQSLRPEHRSAVRQVDSPDAIAPACPQNFNLFSECFAAIAFTNFPIPSNASNFLSLSVSSPTQAGPLNSAPNGTEVLPPTSLLNYTIRADAGLGFIDVVKHGSDFERRVLPLQWAVDSVRDRVLFYEWCLLSKLEKIVGMISSIYDKNLLLFIFSFGSLSAFLPYLL